MSFRLLLEDTDNTLLKHSIIAEIKQLVFRVASTSPEEKIEYLCDLSRDHYNHLECTVNGESPGTDGVAVSSYALRREKEDIVIGVLDATERLA